MKNYQEMDGESQKEKQHSDRQIHFATEANEHEEKRTTQMKTRHKRFGDKHRLIAENKGIVCRISCNVAYRSHCDSDNPNHLLTYKPSLQQSVFVFSITFLPSQL